MDDKKLQEEKIKVILEDTFKPMTLQLRFYQDACKRYGEMLDHAMDRVEQLEAEVLIQAKQKELAIAELIKEGKLGVDGKIVK